MTNAAIYARISLDSTGEGLAVERQLDDARALAAARGWAVVGEYVDNSISASKRNATRPRYEAMREAYGRGEFEAVICYDLDRLTRQPRQLEDWIEDAEERGLKLVTSNGEADLATDGGRMFARIKAAVARQEIERKGARQRRANDQRAAAGIPHKSHRVFGWEPDGLALRESEAQHLREAAAAILAGGTIRAECKRLNEAGILTAHGKAWTHHHLRSALLRERMAGLIMHRGEVLEVESKIEPILSRTDWETLRAILTDPDRNTNRQGRPVEKYWLSSALTCACGAPMQSKTIRSAGKKTPSYVCRVALGPGAGPGHCSVAAHVAEGKVKGMLYGLMSGGWLTTGANKDEVTAARKALDENAEDRREWTGYLMTKGIDKTVATAKLAELADEGTRLRARLDRALAGTQGAEWLDLLNEAGEDSAQSAEAFSVWWDSLPVERRRAFVRAHLNVTVARGGKGSKRVTVDPK